MTDDNLKAHRLRSFHTTEVGQDNWDRPVGMGLRYDTSTVFS